MSLSIIAANGSKRDVSERTIRDENNVPRTISETWVRDENNIPRQVWGGIAGGGVTSLSATASPNDVSGATNRARPATTNETTVTATGGVPPYSYQWTSGSSIHPTAPNSQTTAFVGSVSPNDSVSEEFSCTVKDAANATFVTNLVNATVYNYGSQ